MLLFLLATALSSSLFAQEIAVPQELNYNVYVGYSIGEMKISLMNSPVPKTVQIKGEFKVSGMDFPRVIRSTVDDHFFTAQKVIEQGKDTTEILFDQKKHQVTYPDTQLVIPEQTHDLLGLFLVLQMIDLNSLPQERWVHFNKKNYQAVFTKRGLEKVRGQKGEFRHVLLKVSRPGESSREIHFWLTESPQHIVVKIELEVSLKGILPILITANLTKKDP